MLRTIKWYAGVVITLIRSLPMLRKIDKLKNIPDKQEERDTLIRKGVLFCNDHFFKYTGGTYEVKGAENIPNETVVFMGNHQSNIDIPIIVLSVGRPVGFVAKDDLEKIPILSKWIALTKSVFMDRSTPKKALSAILDGIKIIKSGRSMVIFPEGTRSRKDAMSGFKGGSFKLATKSKVPIVPFSIDGSYKLLEGNKHHKHAHVTITYHPPIETKNLTKEEEANLHNVVEKIVRSSLPNNGQ
ncbi:lysophospholipid acyltransferase family protein [Clostridium tarantellae]|uniref:1-acyl-sn-glycerol-3-phosphate acyltransferase n=1 Tax=Clostridium tarantellae TaxID=39493 RepID=A0A6I1MS71_9CLOT|nr:lysophospholipid acyltransferase family protein [Clostridium tarantellae]MPQ43119.1 1-acylglycerol-3-phosphate O-acyltransferase [Clostridium tarantellae]